MSRSWISIINHTPSPVEISPHLLIQAQPNKTLILLRCTMYHMPNKPNNTSIICRVLHHLDRQIYHGRDGHIAGATKLAKWSLATAYFFFLCLGVHAMLAEMLGTFVILRTRVLYQDPHRKSSSRPRREGYHLRKDWRALWKKEASTKKMQG